MEHMVLTLSIAIVLILGAWIWILKRRASTLSDQVSVLEVTQEARSQSKKKVVDVGSDVATEDNKPGIQTYTLE